MVSVFDLPSDDCGVLPAGRWMLVTRDQLTDSFGGLTLRNGVTVEPVDGRTAARACASLAVVGALRVEGEPCEVGDVSALKPASAEPEPSPADSAPDDFALTDSPELVVKKGARK